MGRSLLVFACACAIGVACVIKPAPPLGQTNHHVGGTMGGAGYGGAPYGGHSYGGHSYGGHSYGGHSYGGTLTHGQAVTYEDITDEAGNTYRITQGVPGNPADIGCADGQREAFAHAGQFPHIAGCLASWSGAASLRAATTGTACGDDVGECATPADACAPGWHVCGANGSVDELRALTPGQCETAGGGRFSAAISHCTAQRGCTYDHNPGAQYPCFERGWCSEAVCCGADCGQFGACRDGVWKQQTHIAQGTDQGCGATTSRRAGGILCCRDS